MRISFISLLAFVSVALAAPSPNNFVVKDSINVPADWVRRSTAADSRSVNLSFALAKRDQQGLEKRLMEVSDPEHATYGRWLSRAEISSYTSPSQDTKRAVYGWLASHGVANDELARRSIGPENADSNTLNVRVSVKKAREMLGGADFAVYEHRDSGEQRLTTNSYSLPRDVANHIDTIFGLGYFGRNHAERAPFKLVTEDAELTEVEGFSPSNDVALLSSHGHASSKPASCNFNSVTAQCLADLYKYNDYKASGKGQFIGISGFLEEYANYNDLASFIADQRKAASGYKFNLQSINGGQNDQSKPGGEANLDVQTVAGAAFPINSTYYTTAGRPPFKPDAVTTENTNEPYSEQLEYLLNLKDVPSILSTSYGDDEQTIPFSYAQRVCGDMAALAARGVTLFYASGDNGVGPDGKCKSNDGKNTTIYLPSWPSTCPLGITSVGGVQDFAPEVVATKAASFIVSGGGFSNYFKRPSYQDAAVSSYIPKLNKNVLPFINQTGRAYPDLAGQASRYRIFISGKPQAISGTSASTPLLASIFALLNDVRIQAGQSNLGFINPWLYKLNGKGFNDITSGAATGCNETHTGGLPATSGYDAATGFGTPDFSQLKELVLSK
ncbi:unnamed protein product [Sympodiomycopsis kandeliae]